MLGYLTLLLICQLAGEVVAKALDLPLPGPVVGMVILFAGLAIRGEVPHDLETVAHGLLDNLSLLFVPAGVGVMLYLPLIEAEWQAIAASLVVSTVVTIAVTALAMRWLDRLFGGSTSKGGPGGGGPGGGEEEQG